NPIPAPPSSARYTWFLDDQPQLSTGQVASFDAQLGAHRISLSVQYSDESEAVSRADVTVLGSGKPVAAFNFSILAVTGQEGETKTVTVGSQGSVALQLWADRSYQSRGTISNYVWQLRYMRGEDLDVQIFGDLSTAGV